MALRRESTIVGTTADWQATDPIIAKGQVTVETPIDALKIGDGVSRYSELDYVTTGTGEYDQIDGGTP